MASTAKKKTKIVCMGDSITQGFGLGADSSAYYPSTLNAYLGDSYTVHNQGVCSTCVTEAEIDGETVGLPYRKQELYSEALKLKGDIYIIMLGTNDASDGLDPASNLKRPLENLVKQNKLFLPSYQSILDDVKKAAPKSKIFLVSPIPIMECIWPKHQERYLAKIIPQIKKLARENKVEFIDLHKEFMSFPEGQLDNLYLTDGLHPNITGAQVIASIIANYVIVRN